MPQVAWKIRSAGHGSHREKRGWAEVGLPMEGWHPMKPPVCAVVG